MKTTRNHGLMRAPVLLTVAAAAGLVFLTTALLSQADEKKPDRPDADAAPLTETRVIERVTAATDKALDWLESKQIKQGDNAGAWSTNQAFNALAMLAFMSSGNTPGRGKYGDVIEDGVLKPGVLTRGKKYMLSKAQPTGYISSGAMYEHGLSTLCLAEMYGMDPDPDLEAKLRKAVDLIVRCQSPAGGWRYTPAPVDQDMSVTVMQVVALRAANNAGIPVPKETFEKATKYVQSSAARRDREADRRIRISGTGKLAADQRRRRALPSAPRTLRRPGHPADAEIPDDRAGPVGRREPAVFLLFPLLRHPGLLPGRRQGLERLAPARSGVALEAPERRRQLGRAGRLVRSGIHERRQSVPDGDGHADPRHLPPLFTGVPAMKDFTAENAESAERRGEEESNVSEKCFSLRSLRSLR